LNNLLYIVNGNVKAI